VFLTTSPAKTLTPSAVPSAPSLSSAATVGTARHGAPLRRPSVVREQVEAHGG